MEEREIEYEDIRPGDHVRFERDRDGVHAELSGIVSHKLWDDNWMTAEGGVIGAWDHSAIVLVGRPKRELPEAGTWVRATIQGDANVGIVHETPYGYRTVETPFDQYREWEVEDFEELVLVPKHEYDQLTGGGR